MLLVAAAAALVAVAEGPAAPSPLCTAAQTRGVVTAFAAAWTRGDVAAVERLVAPEPQFRFLAVEAPRSRGASTFNRDTLRRYIVLRQRQNDHMRVVSFRFHGSDRRGRDVFGHFELEAERVADDWPADLSHVRRGKGAIVCNLSRPMLAAWILG